MVDGLRAIVNLPVAHAIAHDVPKALAHPFLMFFLASSQESWVGKWELTLTVPVSRSAMMECACRGLVMMEIECR